MCIRDRSQHWYIRFIKKWLLPGILKFAWSKKGIRTELFRRVSQIDISYRDSNINLHISGASKVKAGDRLPDVYKRQ